MMSIAWSFALFRGMAWDQTLRPYRPEYSIFVEVDTADVFILQISPKQHPSPSLLQLSPVEW